MASDTTGFREEFSIITWRNKRVTDWVNTNFPGEWERDIVFTALAFAADLDPKVAEILGADKEILDEKK